MALRLLVQINEQAESGPGNMGHLDNAQAPDLYLPRNIGGRVKPGFAVNIGYLDPVIAEQFSPPVNQAQGKVGFARRGSTNDCDAQSVDGNRCCMQPSGKPSVGRCHGVSPAAGSVTVKQAPLSPSSRSLTLMLP